jgi:hypothetical protein
MGLLITNRMLIVFMIITAADFAAVGAFSVLAEQTTIAGLHSVNIAETAFAHPPENSATLPSTPDQQGLRHTFGSQAVLNLTFRTFLPEYGGIFAR